MIARWLPYVCAKLLGQPAHFVLSSLVSFDYGQRKLVSDLCEVASAWHKVD